MEIIRGINKPFTGKGKFTVTVGTFDGVHTGHRRIIERLGERANELGHKSLVFTFHPHPLKLLSPENAPPLLTSTDEKIALIEKLGTDVCVVADFTHEFAAIEPEDFVRDILCQKFSMSLLLVGFDFAFGTGRAGNRDLLSRMSCECKFLLEEVSPVKLGARVVSSTEVRKAIIAGDFESAEFLLGRPYTIRGVIVKGESRGHRIGYPTANLDINSELFLSTGVYAGFARFVSEDVPEAKAGYEALLNVGYRPTFHGTGGPTIEVHVLDFSKEVYGKKIEFAFAAKLRDEVAFENEEALKVQIRKDEKKTREILAG
jgi:riboflavin kinase/FMN adenylyltransferase